MRTHTFHTIVKSLLSEKTTRIWSSCSSITQCALGTAPRQRAWRRSRVSWRWGGGCGRSCWPLSWPSRRPKEKPSPPRAWRKWPLPPVRGHRSRPSARFPVRRKDPWKRSRLIWNLWKKVVVCLQFLPTTLLNTLCYWCVYCVCSARTWGSSSQLYSPRGRPVSWPSQHSQRPKQKVVDGSEDRRRRQELATTAKEVRKIIGPPREDS